MSKRPTIPSIDESPSGHKPPLEHYNYDALENSCGCFLCKDQDLKAEIINSLESASIDHESSCSCNSCKNLRRERLYLTAYAVRRDCYSELTYLVRDRKWRADFLDWFLSILNQPKATSYWSSFMDSQPLFYWLETWALETGKITMREKDD